MLSVTLFLSFSRLLSLLRRRLYWYFWHSVLFLSKTFLYVSCKRQHASPTRVKLNSAKSVYRIIPDEAECAIKKLVPIYMYILGIKVCKAFRAILGSCICYYKNSGNRYLLFCKRYSLFWSSLTLKKILFIQLGIRAHLIRSFYSAAGLIF